MDELNQSIKQKSSIKCYEYLVTPKANSSSKLGYYTQAQLADEKGIYIEGTVIGATIIGHSGHQGYITVNGDGHSFYLWASSDIEYKVRITILQ